MQHCIIKFLKIQNFTYKGEDNSILKLKIKYISNINIVIIIVTDYSKIRIETTKKR